jgi:hypothetical protein
MSKVLQHILIWSFVVFFSFAGSGLTLMAHCQNACEETEQLLIAAKHEHSDEAEQTANCHSHQLKLDNSLTSALKLLPDTKILLTLFHHTHSGECLHTQAIAPALSAPPDSPIAGNDLLTTLSTFII